MLRLMMPNAPSLPLRVSLRVMCIFVSLTVAAHKLSTWHKERACYRTRMAEEMEHEDEEAEQALMRLYNEAYLQRMGRPQEFGA